MPPLHTTLETTICLESLFFPCLVGRSTALGTYSTTSGSKSMRRYRTAITDRLMSVVFVLATPFVLVLGPLMGSCSLYRRNRHHETLRKRGAVRAWRDIERELPKQRSFLLFRRGAGNYPETWCTQIDVLELFEQQARVVIKPLEAWRSRRFTKWLSALTSSSPVESIFRTDFDVEFPILDGAAVLDSVQDGYPNCQIMIVDALGWFPIDSETE